MSKLTNCPDCKGVVSRNAEACPHCGTAIAPPKIPQTYHPTVIVNPPKKGVGIVGGCLVVVFIGFVASIMVPIVVHQVSTGGTPSASTPVSVSPEEEAKSKVQIVQWSSTKSEFGNIMEANFLITNGSSFPVKDLEIKATHFAPSGTAIDSNTRIIYQKIDPGQTLQVSQNMGFVHGQASKSSARITDLVVIYPSK